MLPLINTSPFKRLRNDSLYGVVKMKMKEMDLSSKDILQFAAKGRVKKDYSLPTDFKKYKEDKQ